jgi:SWI/SNF-related matrix-associated actin-dependent regulator of chromatin subfamily A3
MKASLTSRLQDKERSLGSLAIVANHRIAHWIRNQGSEQFKAAVSLKSVRRWCLTGTPIQNSLNDLVSLLGFLHFEPFSSRTIFGRYILAPLADNMENGCCQLRELLRTVCLRRDARLLKLPEPELELVEVTLQQEERALYDKVVARCTRDIDELVSSRTKIKKYGILFRAIMELRRLCNHGASTTLATPNSATEAEPSVGGEQACEFCSGADEDRFELVNQDNFCSECGRHLLSTTGLKSWDPKITLAFGEAISQPNASSQRGASNTKVSEGISTKVQAVINRLKQIEYGSKR